MHFVIQVWKQHNNYTHNQSTPLIIGIFVSKEIGGNQSFGDPENAHLTTDEISSRRIFFLVEVLPHPDVILDL